MAALFLLSVETKNTMWTIQTNSNSFYKQLKRNLFLNWDIFLFGSYNLEHDKGSKNIPDFFFKMLFRSKVARCYKFDIKNYSIVKQHIILKKKSFFIKFFLFSRHADVNTRILSGTSFNANRTYPNHWGKMQLADNKLK